MNMYRHLYVSNEFGDRLPLAEFLTLPPAERSKMAEGRLNLYAIYKRKLAELTTEQREEYERMLRSKRDYQTELLIREVRG
jgi:hypothetical protein